MTYPKAVEQALLVADEWHGNQTYGGAPYVDHLVEVLDIVRAWHEDAPEHMQVAAVLHDIVEDTDYDPLLIQQQFGADVARIVLLVTDPDLPSRSQRKAHVAHVLRGDPEAAFIKLADRLANVRRIDSKRRLRMYALEQATLVHPLAQIHPGVRALATEIDAVLDAKRKEFA